MFYFKADKYDFWKIYESIKRYYPIGVKKDDTRMYFSYPGITELQRIIEDNIHNERNFNSRWKNIEEQIGKALGKEIRGTTYGYAPSFSSAVLLDTQNIHGLTRDKQVQVFLSLVGPYYTVVGLEYLSAGVGSNGFVTTPYLVASPQYEFAETFKSVCDEIEKHFPGYKFVPFRICKWAIEGLDVSYGNDVLNTVFNVLFNDHINLKTERVIGDENYKSEDWIKEGYVEEEDGGKWTMYPPGSLTHSGPGKLDQEI